MSRISGGRAERRPRCRLRVIGVCEGRVRCRRYGEVRWEDAMPSKLGPDSASVGEP